MDLNWPYTALGMHHLREPKFHSHHRFEFDFDFQFRSPNSYSNLAGPRRPEILSTASVTVRYQATRYCISWAHDWYHDDKYWKLMHLPVFAAEPSETRVEIKKCKGRLSRYIIQYISIYSFTGMSTPDIARDPLAAHMQQYFQNITRTGGGGGGVYLGVTGDPNRTNSW